MTKYRERIDANGVYRATAKIGAKQSKDGKIHEVDAVGNPKGCPKSWEVQDYEDYLKGFDLRIREEARAASGLSKVSEAGVRKAAASDLTLEEIQAAVALKKEGKL